jgi:hypothetical protein
MGFSRWRVAAATLEGKRLAQPLAQPLSAPLHLPARCSPRGSLGKQLVNSLSHSGGSSMQKSGRPRPPITNDGPLGDRGNASCIARSCCRPRPLRELLTRRDLVLRKQQHCDRHEHWMKSIADASLRATMIATGQALEAVCTSRSLDCLPSQDRGPNSLKQSRPLFSHTSEIE